jgi:hypothetical protein
MDIDINDLADSLKDKYRKWDMENLKSLMFREQWRFICNLYYKPQVDFIGRFENLKDDWSYVAKKLNLVNKLPYLNKSDKENPIMTSRTKDIIKEIYQKDFKTFGYEY